MGEEGYQGVGVGVGVKIGVGVGVGVRVGVGVGVGVGVSFLELRMGDLVRRPDAIGDLIILAEFPNSFMPFHFHPLCGVRAPETKVGEHALM